MKEYVLLSYLLSWIFFLKSVSFFFSDSIWTWDRIGFDSIEIYFLEEKIAYVSYISL